MNVECQLNQLRGLMQLLRTEDDDGNSDNSDNDDPIVSKPSTSQVTPGLIKPANKKPKSDEPTEPSPYTKLEDLPAENYDDYEEELESYLPTPEFKISYKQAVATEDVYLGMSNKSPLTASCEDIVLEIKLPEETVGIEEMSVNVTEKEVHFQSPKYKTKIALPYPVDPNKGKAIYHSEHKVLKLTLRMKRELDFTNF